ncbi:DNA polymerase clamp loader subunit A, partial [Arthrospira platensis SPKY1]|nr:DNA polymerase clamp loader subunit A [Arthrospira platensis SPKY1]
DFLDDLTFHKCNILNEDNESEYSTYMVNRFISMDPSLVLIAAEMASRTSLPKDMQYDFYLHSIKKRKRYLKFMKATKNDVAPIVAEYLGCSNRVAREIVSYNLVDSELLQSMKQSLFRGGLNVKSKKSKK